MKKVDIILIEKFTLVSLNREAIMAKRKKNKEFTDLTKEIDIEIDLLPKK